MDDGRVDDGMTIEELAKEFRATFEEARQRLSSMDQKIDSVDATMRAGFEEMDARFATIDKRFDALDGNVSAHDARFESLETKVDSLDARMRIGFEETHRLIKLGVESVQILDEKVDRRFNETERQHADHRTLIEAAVKRLRRDVEPRRKPAQRRR